MSFKKFTEDDNARRRRGGAMTLRFKGGAIFLSKGLVDRASRLLQSLNAIEEGDKVRYVELWYDEDEGLVGVKPVGHKGLTEDILMSRDGVKKITGGDNHVVSCAAFQRVCGVPDGVKIEVEERQVEMGIKNLPLEAQRFTLFVGKV